MKLQGTIDAVLFDLDGTLVHTAPCIAAALNQALADNHLGAIKPAVVSTMIGSGVPTLIERALIKLGKAADPQVVASVLARYRAAYLAPDGPLPVAFPGVEDALTKLHRAGFKLGVVTNTFDRFVHTILQKQGWHTCSIWSSVRIQCRSANLTLLRCCTRAGHLGHT